MQEEQEEEQEEKKTQPAACPSTLTHVKITVELVAQPSQYHPSFALQALAKRKTYGRGIGFNPFFSRKIARAVSIIPVSF